MAYFSFQLPLTKALISFLILINFYNARTGPDLPLCTHPLINLCSSVVSISFPGEISPSGPRPYTLHQNLNDPVLGSYLLKISPTPASSAGVEIRGLNPFCIEAGPQME